jgi:hypothetical protein
LASPDDIFRKNQKSRDGTIRDFTRVRPPAAASAKRPSAPTPGEAGLVYPAGTRLV